MAWAAAASARLLLEQLARITARGELVKLDEGQWSLPHSTPEKTARQRPQDPHTYLPVERKVTRDNLVAGRLDLHRDGFGFVRPNGSGAREDDLFIPPNELNGAMQGDEVLVEEAPPGPPRRGWQGATLRPRRAHPHAPQPDRRRHLPLRPPAPLRRRPAQHRALQLRHPARRAHDPAHPHPRRSRRPSGAAARARGAPHDWRRSPPHRARARA